MDIESLKLHVGKQVAVYDGAIPKGETLLEGAIHAHRFGNLRGVRNVKVVSAPRVFLRQWRVEVEEAGATAVYREHVKIGRVLCEWTMFEEVLRLRKEAEKREREEGRVSREASERRVEVLEAALKA